MPNSSNSLVKQSSLVAAAGEYYVLARLCLSNRLAAQAPRGVPNADIVVCSIEGDRLCAIQVKTRSGKGADRGWHMRKKHESVAHEKLFYAFVDFENELKANPRIYILPSQTVATAIQKMHAEWLARPGKKGQKHNDSDLRRFMPDFSINCGQNAAPYIEGWLDEFLEAWHLLPRAGEL